MAKMEFAELEVKQALVVECGGVQQVLTTEDVEGIPMVKINPQQAWIRKLLVEKGGAELSSAELSRAELSAAIGMAMQEIRQRIQEARVQSGQADATQLEDLLARASVARTLIGLGESESEEEYREAEQKQPPTKKMRGQGSKTAPLQATISIYFVAQFFLHKRSTLHHSTVRL